MFHIVVLKVRYGSCGEMCDNRQGRNDHHQKRGNMILQDLSEVTKVHDFVIGKPHDKP